MSKSINTLIVFSVVFVMVAMSFAFVASYNSNAATPHAAASSTTPTGKFIIGTPLDTSVADLNPFTTTNSLASDLVQQMYADSLGFLWTNGNLSAWLAKSWTVTNNGNGTQTITFNLNPNADWINGSKVVGQITSADVAFTFDVMKANTSLDPYAVMPHVLSMTEPSATQITFLMNSQSILWIQLLASQTIIPKAWSAYDHGNLSNIGQYTNMGPYGQEITAGPYYLSSVTSEGGCLTANTHFWMGVPHIETVFWEKFSTTATAALALKKGQISADLPALSDYNGLKGIKNITLIRQVEPWVFYLWMNDKLAPYSNVTLRQGMAYAINKTQIMIKAEDTIGSWGQSNTSDGGLPTIMKADWASGLTYYAYNPAKAKEMIAKAGYHIDSNGYFANNSTNKELTFSIVEPSNIADWVSAGGFIAADLKAVGINAVENVVPISTWANDVFVSAANYSDFNVLTYFGYVPNYVNPYAQLQEPYAYNGGWNFEWYSNSSLNTIFNSTENIGNIAQMVQDLYPAQKIIDQQIPIIPIGDAGNFFAFNNALVTGFYDNLTIQSPLNFMAMHIPTSGSSPSTGSSSNDIYYIIGGVVAAIVIIGAVVVLTTRNKGKGEK